MEYRTIITDTFEPSGGEDGELPLRFVLRRRTEHQARRSSRENWQLDTAKPGPSVEYNDLAVFTRRQLSGLLASGTDWLAYNPATDG